MRFAMIQTSGDIGETSAEVCKSANFEEVGDLTVDFLYHLEWWQDKMDSMKKLCE